jgi:hypothetical protein
MNYIDFINHLCKTVNNCLIHGFAGTGKSTLIKEISKMIGSRCLKLAPTGRTAYNIDGATIDSLLCCYDNAQTSALSKLEELYDCIIIDEISMVDMYKLDKIYDIREKLIVRGKKLKLILIGDPFQLPPVATKNKIAVFSEKYNKPLTGEDLYFFTSAHFQKDYLNTMECFLLAKNFRQNDGRFQQALCNIATGSATQRDLDYINGRVIEGDQCLNIDYTPIVVPQRSGVTNFNNFFLSKFDQKDCNNALVEFILPGFEEINSDYKNITEPVIYALGAPIVFTQNDLYGHWVNGTRGIVNNWLWNYSGNTALEIRTDRNELVNCVPTRHCLRRFVYNSEKDTVENECVAVIWQLPFVLGFALTVHKVQGMTLNSMAFNIGGGIFSPGQLYVALSRVRKLDGLTLHVPLRKNDVTVSDNVRVYFDDFQEKCKVVQLDEDGNRLFPQFEETRAIPENGAISKWYRNKY